MRKFIAVVLISTVVFCLSASMISAKPLVLKGQTFMPATHAISVGVKWLSNAVNEKTQGKVQMKYILGSPYGKLKGAWDQVTSGVTDYTLIVPLYQAGRLPIQEFLCTPFQWPSAQKAGAVFAELYRKGYFDKGMAKGPFKPICFVSGEPYALITKKPVKNPADMKGMKIRGVGLFADAVEAWGATPVSITSGEQYMALETGILDGTVLSVSSAYALKLQESCKYINAVNMMTYIGIIAVTEETWNKIPSDVKKIITDHIDEWTIGFSKAYDDQGEKAKKKLLKAGVQFYTPTAAEYATWKALSRPVTDRWIKKLNKMNFPMDQYMKDIKSIAQKNGFQPY